MALGLNSVEVSIAATMHKQNFLVLRDFFYSLLARLWVYSCALRKRFLLSSDIESWELMWIQWNKSVCWNHLVGQQSPQGNVGVTRDLWDPRDLSNHPLPAAYSQLKSIEYNFQKNIFSFFSVNPGRLGKTPVGARNEKDFKTKLMRKKLILYWISISLVSLEWPFSCQFIDPVDQF